MNVVPSDAKPVTTGSKAPHILAGTLVSAVLADMTIGSIGIAIGGSAFGLAVAPAVLAVGGTAAAAVAVNDYIQSANQADVPADAYKEYSIVRGNSIKTFFIGETDGYCIDTTKAGGFRVVSHQDCTISELRELYRKYLKLGYVAA